MDLFNSNPWSITRPEAIQTIITQSELINIEFKLKEDHYNWSQNMFCCYANLLGILVVFNRNVLEYYGTTNCICGITLNKTDVYGTFFF